MKDKRLLFCLAHAGASASKYHRWSRELPGVSVVPLELNGRGTRINSVPHKRFKDAVAQLTEQVISSLRTCTTPYCIFGHSIGAVLGLAVERNLELHGHQALGLVLAGRGTPYYSRVLDRPIAHLSDDELIVQLGVFGGLPDAMITNQEIRELFLPIIRADFALLEDARELDLDRSVNCPVHILNGLDDTTCGNPQAIVNAWASVTTERSTFHTFDGGHFFVDSNLPRIWAIINNVLSETGRVNES
ncbi:MULTISPECIES: thioesterase II family protein [Rothia]|uniref:thioesterase II family protein n=1 Tax=Rothia TaxID=32207 RepID=UPI0009F4A0C9|nr:MULTISPECIES: thioesterase domain-containing protein [Rothia]